MTRRRQRGFTLIEMITVVVILGVLAAIAIPAYNRYMDSGRASEAMAMLGEIRNKEEAYRAEYGTYLQLNTETAVFPTVGTCPTGQVEPCAKPATAATGATVPTTWQTLGINTTKGQLYCGYTAVAGLANTAPTGALGLQFLGSAAQPGVWWYAVAICDNNRTVTANTTYVTLYNSTTVMTLNEHK